MHHDPGGSMYRDPTSISVTSADGALVLAHAFAAAGSADGRSLEPEGIAEHAPVLALGIQGDLVAPDGAIAALVGRFDASRPRCAELAAMPTSRWRRHFTWVHKPASVVDAILDWMPLASLSRP